MTQFLFLVFFALMFFVHMICTHPLGNDNERIWMASLSDPKEALLLKQEKKKSRNYSPFGYRKIVRCIKRKMPNIPQDSTQRLARVIDQMSKQYRFHPALILSLISVESGFNAWAISSTGAIGLMQLMPETGRWLADRMGARWDGPATLLDPEVNVRFGVYYLAYLREKYNGDPKAFLAAYNVGPRRIDDWASMGHKHGLEYYKLVKQNLPAWH